MSVVVFALASAVVVIVSILRSFRVKSSEGVGAT
jgi:hypothetical protein